MVPQGLSVTFNFLGGILQIQYTESNEHIMSFRKTISYSNGIITGCDIIILNYLGFEINSYNLLTYIYIRRVGVYFSER